MSQGNLSSSSRGYRRTAATKLRAMRVKRMLDARKRKAQDIAVSPVDALINVIWLAMLAAGIWILWMFISSDIILLHYPVGLILFGYIAIVVLRTLQADWRNWRDNSP